MRIGLSLRTAVITAVSLAAAAAAVALSATGAGAVPAPDADRSADASDQRRGAGIAGGRAVLRLKDTRFGPVIHEKRSGLVAYLFTRERRGKPRCYGACARAWPPIKTKGRPRAGSGLAQRHLGTVRRRGGSRMVTYRGRPLYFYEHDAPGVILCHDVAEFGGRWFVVGRDGKPA